MRMHYNNGVFKAVRDSDWSADHVAVQGGTLDEVREAILEHPYWAVPGRVARSRCKAALSQAVTYSWLPSLKARKPSW